MPENFEDKFNKLMKNQGMEKLAEKPKEVFKVYFENTDGAMSGVLAEFDTKKELDEWMEQEGGAIKDDNPGGRIIVEEGFSELEEEESEEK